MLYIICTYYNYKNIYIYIWERKYITEFFDSGLRLLIKNQIPHIKISQLQEKKNKQMKRYEEKSNEIKFKVGNRLQKIKLANSIYTNIFVIDFNSLS